MFEDNYYEIVNGNMLEELDKLGENSVDSIVTDPPYELNFMNRGWDNAGISFQKETWKKCLRVLKPGGYLLAFGGSRTFHRIAVAIEDAGFEIRDTIMWLYGSGFPKSMALDKAIESKLTTGNSNKTQFHKLSGIQEDKHHYGFTTKNKEMGIRPKDYTTEGVSQSYLKELDATTELGKQYKGWGTCLKPSFEPIIVARKPLEGSCVDNVIKYGVGGINIDECRIPLEDGFQYKETNRKARSEDTVFDNNHSGFRSENNTTASASPDGRFPANTILTYDDTDYAEVCSGFPQTKSTGGSGQASKMNTFSNTYNGGWGHDIDASHLGGLGDEGSASRYFYCAKASAKDRDEGLDGFDAVKCSMMASNANINSNGDFTGMLADRDTRRRNIHPTVKPTTLMQYLIRLVTPKGGTVLDPFNGSGSTGKAIMFENRERNAKYKYIGIELDSNYCDISKARIFYALNNYVYESEIKSETKNTLQKDTKSSWSGITLW